MGTARRCSGRPASWLSVYGDRPGCSRAYGAVAERLAFDLTEELGYRYPDFSDRADPAIRQLAAICDHAFGERYGASNRLLQADARTRLEGELG